MGQNLSSDPRWTEFRSLMPVAEKWAYMDHAAVAPLPAPTRDAIRHWCDEASWQGDLAWPRWAAQVETVRALGARLINAGEDEIAFVHNTTAGITLVAEGLAWRPGDNLVTLSNEFPSNLYPWMNLGTREVETRRVPVEDGRVDPDLVLSRCDSRTRLIAVSWVGYATGWRLDLASLVHGAHERGILVFLDAIQGLGVFPLDVQQTPVDFLAADGHKWMLGPEGAGLFYVRREHLERLRPIGVGWNSVVHAHDFTHIALDLRPTAVRYEGGSQNMVGVLGLGASLALLERLGLSSGSSAVAARVLEVTDFACRRLEEVGARIVSRREGASRSGIVAFEVPGRDSEQLRRACIRQGVVLSCRAGRLRISPHAYTNADDIQRLVSVIERA
ncbi:MAG: aminotransferase class V-fold PLP-dependent enzyme [Pirellulaceae bacterium]